MESDFDLHLLKLVVKVKWSPEYRLSTSEIYIKWWRLQASKREKKLCKISLKSQNAKFESEYSDYDYISEPFWKKQRFHKKKVS